MDPSSESIDETKLNGEGGEPYLFRWLSSLEKRISSLDTDELKTQQATFTEVIVKAVTSVEPFPPPGRPVRHVAARCLVAIFARGETRPMYDTLQLLLKPIGDLKVADKDVQKTACLYCIGELMERYGSQVMSLMGDIMTVTMKLFRSSPTNLVRYHALVTMRQSLVSAKRAVPDSTLKDVVKQGRNALNDKCLVVQRAACELLIVMHPIDEPTRTASDIESILALSTRALESADQVTRAAHARLVGHLLASSQVERVVAAAPSTKKPKKEAEGEEDDGGPGSVAPTEIAVALMKPEEMLAHLSSQYNKGQATRKTRIGIASFYQALLVSLGPAFVETHYALIVAHLMTEVLSGAKVAVTAFESQLTQRLVGILLRDLIGLRMLGEQAQIDALMELSSTYLRKWPALLPGQSAPSAPVLYVALGEVAGLLQQLGNAPANVQEALSDPLVTLLGHPRDSIRARAAWALRCFCHVIPSRLPKILLHVLELIQRDIGVIATPAASQDIAVRFIGHAYGLAALVAVIPERPLYVSYDSSAKILDLAIQLLKRAGSHDTHIATIEIEVAWTLIASLMTLGPNFVRSQLPQLLVLWRNALPKPTSKDSDGAGGRTQAEWLFLLQVRESAVGAIFSFLTHNAAALLTLDVARRIASLLANVLSFVHGMPSQKVEIGVEGQTAEGSALQIRESALRRRTYQCYTVLGFSGVTDSTQTALLQSAVTLFASAEGYNGSALQAAIASSTGELTSLMQCTDGYAYGVTNLKLDHSAEAGAADEAQRDKRERLNRDAVDNALDELTRTPVLLSLDHDALLVCTHRSSSTELARLETPPAATGVVDAAIRLFGALLASQDTPSATRSLQQLVESVRSPKLEKNNGRRLAVLFNAVIAVSLALREAGSRRAARETFSQASVTAVLSPFLLDTLGDGDTIVRAAASESIGRLAGYANPGFLTILMKDLVDRVVTNRDPNARAGCALSFGSVFVHIGGLAAGPLLKTAVNVLMSLSIDPHPVVHYWALAALAEVINAASLAYAPFVHGTLSTVFKIYSSDVHEPEGGSLHSINIGGDLPSYQVLCDIVDAMVNVLGPDLQEASTTQGLVIDLVHEVFLETDEGVRVEATKCMQHLLLFAPDKVSVPDLVITFRTFLGSHRRLLKIAAINALYQLVQKDALAISKIGGDQLVEDLFAMLDSDPTIEGVRGVITNWLRQTAVLNPSAWIDVCRRIMSRTIAQGGASDQKGGAAHDDEGESLNVAAMSAGSAGAQPNARWRTQLFALECLHTICSIVARSGRKEHVDERFARAHGVPTRTLLISRVPDLIRMAFTASASHVPEIRLEGLALLKDVIETFASSPDPDFEDALLLEQHQAPITAALTPAFSADSTPEILASAVEACAIFVGSGVVKDVAKMGRILRLLTSVLDQSRDTGTLSLGDAGELSPNASVMLRIAALMAWAKLQVSSPVQPYLRAVLEPHRRALASLWVVSLRDYASLRAELEVVTQDSSSTPLESSSFSLGRDVLLPYYIEAWPVIMQAIAIAMQAGDPHVMNAMDGVDDTPTTDPKSRQEPAALFFVIFGLAFEALLSSADDGASASSAGQNVKIALQALQYLVQPEYSGKTFVDGPLFDELVALAYRMAMTEPAHIQQQVIEVVTNVARSRLQQLPRDTADPFSAVLPQVQCVRVVSFILQQAVSSRKRANSQVNASSAPTDRVNLVKAGFEALATLTGAFDEQAREDLRGVAMALYYELLKDESSNVDFVEPTLQSLRLLLLPPDPLVPSYMGLVHGLLSGCVSCVDELRGREGLISTKKTKNNLLAAVLVLTTPGKDAQLSRAVLEHLCFLLSAKLMEDAEVSLTSAQCARTIITAAVSGSEHLRGCIPHLLPSMINYIGKAASLDPEQTSAHQLATSAEILKSFGVVLSGLAESQQSVLMGVFLPAFSLLLENDSTNPSGLMVSAVGQLLALAASHGGPFREAIVKLETPTREVLEKAMRTALGQRGGSAAQTSAKPQISLRAF